MYDIENTVNCFLSWQVTCQKVLLCSTIKTTPKVIQSSESSKPNANSEVMRVIALLSRILLPFMFFNYLELTVFEMIVNVGECCLIYCFKVRTMYILMQNKHSKYLFVISLIHIAQS